MTQTFAPYGTLINDPQLSKTAGRWAWATVPGHTGKAQSRTWIDGHFLSVPKYAKYPDWSMEFIRMACSKQWMLRSMERGNAPPRGSVLRDPDNGRETWLAAGGSRGDRDRVPDARSSGVGRARNCRCGAACRKPCWGRRLQSRHWMNWRATGSATSGELVWASPDRAAQSFHDRWSDRALRDLLLSKRPKKGRSSQPTARNRGNVGLQGRVRKWNYS